MVPVVVGVVNSLYRSLEGWEGSQVEGVRGIGVKIVGQNK